jgi:hypothetical protein
MNHHEQPVFDLPPVERMRRPVIEAADRAAERIKIREAMKLGQALLPNNIEVIVTEIQQ